MNSSNTKIVKSGSTFQISLKGNMSTGYRWCLARLPESLCLVGEELYSDPHPPQVVGVGDTQVFYFKAMKSTLAPESLSFIRMRVWNDDIIEEQVWQVTVSQNENEVSYQVVNNYVVGHEVKAGKHYFIFDKFDQFQKVFYPAAVMGSQRWLTVEDFAHHVVIAVIEPENNAVSDYEFKQTPHISTTLWLLIMSAKRTLHPKPLSASVRF